MHGVSDRAGSECTLRWRCTRCCLPPVSTSSASRSTCRLRGRPFDFAAQYLTCTFPCQRFDAASRAAPHDSEPLRLAKPLTYETLIHNTLPVLTGARDFMPQEYIEIRDAPERLT